MKILLCTAPMVQINTPYPATAYLKGFLDEHAPGVTAVQQDPALLLVLRLFSREGLKKLKRTINPKTREPQLLFFLDHFKDYERTVADAIGFLQGKRPELTAKIAARDFLPEGYRFSSLENEKLADELLAQPEDKQALHLASLFVDDIADYFRLGADARFEFSRYGEKLAASQTSFSALKKNLDAEPTLVDETLSEIMTELLTRHKPDVLAISAPFSGTVYGAFRMGALARKKKIPVVLGGGYPNTELRRLSDPRVFDYVDFITIDDGERPLLALIDHFRGHRPKEKLHRTFYREGERVVYAVNPLERDVPFPETGTPSYEGLPVRDYIAMAESLNPVTQLWSGEFWNKLTLAHGCYWHRCTFCDTSLDYIGRYETEKASALADKMEKISSETGAHGFHFVDEAAPPAILRGLSKELINRGTRYRWWGNIRFDKAFASDLPALMQRAGCIAVTGGLEVASPRVLKLIDKGVTIEDVVKVTKAFREAGIFVHAYLMYGFPTQTLQETVDSLEVVRQLFATECLQSAFWHRFAATAHSPVGKNPEKFGIKILPPLKPSKSGLFSENDLRFEDKTGVDHDRLGVGLRYALYNYMHGIGLDFDVREWFEDKVPKTKIPARLVADLL